MPTPRRGTAAELELLTQLVRESYDFSFSGLKTAVLTQVKRLAHAAPEGPATSRLDDPLSAQQKADDHSAHHAASPTAAPPADPAPQTRP